MKRKIKNDFLLTGAILIIALVAFAIYMLTSSGGNTVKISVDGKIIKSFDLKSDINYQIKSGNNINNLVIEDGKAYIEYANCPDKICQHHRKISNAGETIVCLPHKVVITIESEK